ncbi:MAG: hypothetical protein DMG45_18650 [Acidobacteria bacterium]|nr:MAG: hypothetical protein AUH16_02020 [Acidobacteria bacterium 13_2_20CM_57_7]PYT39848.1 MAG: hypothetical protein DMG45_18650 [Acidobacteriota bacterium]PYT47349.1 MAG: hypothetical protein DMG47_02100 [Acidobacteriota bacterium]
MSVRVVLTSGNNSYPRLHRRREFRHRRILASVMPDFKHIGAHCLGAILGKNFTLNLFFGVSRQQN